MEVKIGSKHDSLKEFEMILQAEKLDGTMFVITVFRAKSTGTVFGMEEKAFGEYEQTIEVMYDRTQDGICLVEEVVTE